MSFWEEFMRLMLITLITFFMAFKVFSANFEIKGYRFHTHSTEDYDRLVLDMSGSSETPVIKVNSDSGSEALIEVQNAKLMGVVPESSINNSYVSTSRYLGPINISTESPSGGFTIKLWLKKPNTKIDAFWHTNPSRLVIDVYPQNSLRAKGMEKSRNRKLAASSTNKPYCKSEELPKYLCFPAGARVGLKVKFDVSPYLKTTIQSIPVQLGAVSDSLSGQDAIVCYPSIARVTPSFTFEPFVEPEQINETSRLESSTPQANAVPQELLRQPSSKTQSLEGVNNAIESEDELLPIAPPPPSGQQLPPALLLPTQPK